MIKPTPELVELKKKFIKRAKRLALMLAADAIPDKEIHWQIRVIEDALIRIEKELEEIKSHANQSA